MKLILEKKDTLNWLLDHEGISILDKHLNRIVKRIIGHIVRFDRYVIEELKREKPLNKYVHDSERMEKFLEVAVEKYKNDHFSRQLLVLNADNYLEEQQCFQLMQFVNEGDGMFAAQIYQRSCDLEKFIDDLVFFANLINSFEKQTQTIVNSLTVMYGDIHKQVEN